MGTAGLDHDFGNRLRRNVVWANLLLRALFASVVFPGFISERKHHGERAPLQSPKTSQSTKTTRGVVVFSHYTRPAVRDGRPGNVDARAVRSLLAPAFPGPTAFATSHSFTISSRSPVAHGQTGCLTFVLRHSFVIGYFVIRHYLPPLTGRTPIAIIRRHLSMPVLGRQCSCHVSSGFAYVLAYFWLLMRSARTRSSRAIQNLHCRNHTNGRLGSDRRGDLIATSAIHLRVTGT